MITHRRAKRPPLSAVRRSRLALGLAMGKKSRAVPGRRPILQLSPPGPRSSTPSRDPEPEPDAEPDSTAAAAPSQPAPAAVSTTTTAVTAAAAASEDSPSEGKACARALAPRWAQSETRARGLRPRSVRLGLRGTRSPGGRRPPPRPAARGLRAGRLWARRGGRGRGAVCARPEPAQRRHLGCRAWPGPPSLLPHRLLSVLNNFTG